MNLKALRLAPFSSSIIRYEVWVIDYILGLQA